MDEPNKGRGGLVLDHGSRIDVFKQSILMDTVAFTRKSKP